MSDTLVKRLAMLLTACTVGAGVAAFTPHARAAESSAPPEAAASQQATSPAKPKPDLSGRKRVGEASFYAKKFTGRKMADGTPMDPHGDNAASKTLPLGTTAKVTNLETGQSAVVTIQDRGPYVKGRIVDLSPSTAQKIGITRNDGVANVEVVPIAVPQPDGSVKPGVAAQGAKSR
jgi:rare lipoprotein A